jgi:DNA-binding protein HU-beta
MTKADLIAQIAEGTGLTKVETRAVVEGFMTTVQNAMKDGKRIELRGFGVFEVQHRAPRTGRNPQTNEPPSDKLSEAVDAAQKAERE